MVEVYEVSSDGIFLSVECESYELFAVGSHPSDVSEWYCEWQSSSALFAHHP